MGGSPLVLAPLLIRPSLHPELRARFLAAAEALEGNVRLAVDEAEWPKAYPSENYWGRFARMRQAIIERELADEAYVLWIDADLSFEPDLLTRLLAIHEAAILSPLVLIEGTEIHYDTAGTRPAFEHRSSSRRPEPGLREMFSVGACVLVPAEIHRRVRFEAQADEDRTANTEWTSLCVGARELGWPVLWDTRLEVFHADLPAWGESWH